MRILVIGGHGKTGIEVLKEAQARNHEVVALTRRNEAVVAGKQIIKSVFDLNAEDLKSYDAVVNALGFWTEDTLSLHKKAMQHLCTILAGNQTNYVVVGGAGSLFVNKEHSVKLEETPDFPYSYKAVSKATGEAFEELKKHSKKYFLIFILPNAHGMLFYHIRKNTKIENTKN